jgi:carboxymethylenebutenolidase
MDENWNSLILPLAPRPALRVWRHCFTVAATVEISRSRGARLGMGSRAYVTPQASRVRRPVGHETLLKTGLFRWRRCRAMLPAFTELPMKRLTAADFDQELLILFDAYVHGAIDRRGFLDGARRFAVGGLTAAGLLAALSPQFAAAQVVPKDDPRIKTERVEFASPSGHGSVKGYLCMPVNATGKLPGILVAHENRGLNPHIEDIARRLALDNFVAFAPDALTPLGGYPGDEDKARALFAQLDQVKTAEDFLAAAAVLKGRAEVNGKIGVVGFCWGGGMAHTLATRLPTLGAAVPFYGNHPPSSEAAKVRAQLLIHFAGVDERINAAWPPYEAALKAAGARCTAHSYAGTQHGFNNDTTPRFDATAARLAWERTLAFFNQHLRA